MKIRKTLVFLSLSSLLMSGCQNQINGIYVENNYDVVLNDESSYFQKIVLDDLFLKIENQETFPLLYHSRGCSLCEEAERILRGYFENIQNPFLIYRLETDNRIQEEMMVRYPTYFANLGAPELFLFENGKPIIDLTYNVLSNYGQFYSRYHKRFKRQCVNYLTKESSFNNYMESAKNILVYFFDSTIKEELSFYQNYIQERAKKSNNYILKLDRNYIEDGALQYFYSYFNASNEYENPLLVDYKNISNMELVNYISTKEKAEIILDDFFRK